MTLDDLPFLDGHESPAIVNGAKGKPKCQRHEWQLWVESESGLPFTRCARCGKTRDAASSRRGRTNASRGKRIQRQRIEGLGGTNLAGNNPNLDGIGELFRYESKSGGSFSERYWRWLRGIPKGATQVGVLIVTDTPGPGHRARSIVVVDYDDWRDLHGELEA